MVTNRDRDTGTDTGTDIDTDRDTDRESDIDRDRDTDTDRESDTDRDRSFPGNPPPKRGGDGFREKWYHGGAPRWEGAKWGLEVAENH